VRRPFARRGASTAGDRPVELAELISPLRYDILVRARFLEVLGEQLDAVEHDLDRVVREATGTPYHRWFTGIALPRYRPREAAGERRARAAFRERVRRSAELVASFRARGFDERFPVLLRAARPGAMTASGKLVARPLYAGDGCHRLALLLASGHRFVEPAWYRVRRDPLDAPIDNTRPLLGPLAIGAAEYHRFLAVGYGLAGSPGELPADRETLLRRVEAERPDRVDELARVLQIDEPAILRDNTPSDRTIISILTSGR
jgi:hypothetical protein